MPLDLNTLIEPSSIFSIKALSPGHPVYLLEGWTLGTGLVIKQESTIAAKNVKTNAMIMHAVSPGATAVPLKPAELQALRTWSTANPESAAGRAVVSDLVQTGTWLKMKAAQGLIDLKGAANAALAGDKSDVRLIAKALNAPGGLEALGAIIAADAFNANNDRFAFDGQGGMNWQGSRLQCLANVGNVFIAANKSGAMTPIGLDTWDPGSQHKDLRDPLNEQLARWPGRLLADPAKADRTTFADMVVDDLETVLGPRNRNFFAKALVGTDRLDRQAKPRVVTGIEAGARKIRDYLKHRYGPASRQTLPVGLAQRLSAAGWLSRVDFPLLAVR
jgi:hypothetical protein